MYRFLTRSYWTGYALSGIPPWVQAASKQGAVRRSRSEVVLVNAPSGDYVFCVITKNQEDESWDAPNEGWELIRKVSEQIWNYFEPGHRSDTGRRSGKVQAVAPSSVPSPQSFISLATSPSAPTASSSCASLKYGAGPRRRASPRKSVRTPRSRSPRESVPACGERSARNPARPVSGVAWSRVMTAGSRSRASNRPASRATWCWLTVRRKSGVSPSRPKKSKTDAAR